MRFAGIAFSAIATGELVPAAVTSIGRVLADLARATENARG